MKGFNGVMAIVVLCVLASCASYSKYPIDLIPQYNVDNSLCGIWKAAEDTDRANFILIQHDSDTRVSIDKMIARYGSMGKYHLETTKGTVFEDDVDTSKWISIYKSMEVERNKIKSYTYYLTYFNMHGQNPLYQQWTSHMSKVGGSRFLNISYRPEDSQDIDSYIFVRLIEVTPNSITTALVSDPILKTLKSPAQVRSCIERNINNKSFYSDTLHFKKVEPGHFRLNESVRIANK